MKSSAQPNAGYRYLWPFLQAEWLLFIKTALCVLGYVATVLILPRLVGNVTEYIGAGDVKQPAYWLGLAAIAFTVLNNF